MSEQKLRVGIFGLGIIGSRIAGHLRDAGFAVSVWNRTPMPDVPGFLQTPADVARAADVLQFFVADPKAVDDVLDAIGDALTSRHIVVMSSTLGREATLEAARRVQAKGARFLDVPFTGTKGAATNKQLVYYIGGNDATLEVVRPMLEPVSKAIVPIGEIGQAALVKVLTNVIAAATVEVLAESVAVLKAEGLDPVLLAKALEHHGVRSGMSDLKMPRLLKGDYEDTHFSLKHMLKDLQFGVEEAQRLGLDLPVTAATTQVLREGQQAGWGDLDFACILRRYEK